MLTYVLRDSAPGVLEGRARLLAQAEPELRAGHLDVLVRPPSGPQRLQRDGLPGELNGSRGVARLDRDRDRHLMDVHRRGSEGRPRVDAFGNFLGQPARGRHVLIDYCGVFGQPGRDHGRPHVRRPGRGPLGRCRVRHRRKPE
ncbi:hypothetical protein ACFVH6_33340 [Spirillospora sp. NPDC127200]